MMMDDGKGVLALLEDVSSQEVDKFDAVVSNPPYQVNVGGDKNTAVANAVWQEFVLVAAVTSKYASFVNPGRWMRGGYGTGLGKIRDYFFTSGHLSKFIIFQDSHLFHGVSIGPVTIELFNFSGTAESLMRGQYENGNVITYNSYKPTSAIDIIIQRNDEEIIAKMLDNSISDRSVEPYFWVGGENNKTKKASSVIGINDRDNYGIRTPRFYRDTDYFILDSERESGKSYLKIYYSPKAVTIESRYLPLDELQDNQKNRESIIPWKACIPRTSAVTIYRNVGPICAPNEISTNTWLCRSFSSLSEVEGYISYTQTYLYRYLLSVRAISHDAYAHVHRWVPDLADVENPRTGKMGYESDWTDDDLRILFKDVLTDEDWRYIKAQAIAADNGRGDYEAGYELPKPYNWDELHPGEEWSGKRWSLTLEDEPAGE